MSNDELRAGDEDRDNTSATLREAYAEGRLDHDEFETRLHQAQQAKTFGELASLTRDLPTMTGARTAPVPAPEAAISTWERDRRKGLRAAWASWLGVSIMVNVIWFATWMGEGGDAPYYWPIWVMGPWGGAMVIATLAGKSEG